MLTILIPLFVALISLVVYVITSNPKVAELARLTFVCGVFWSVSPFVSKSVTLLN